MLQPYLFVDETPGMGRGVFTTEPIFAGTIIEISPVIVMSKDDKVYLNKTLLHDYIFDWGINKDKCCMALGLIPIYNHCYTSNCEYFMDYEADTIMIKTVCEVEEGEELTINYNGDFDDMTELWFKAN